MPTSVLGRLASRAIRLFATDVAAPSPSLPLSSAAAASTSRRLPFLVSSTRSLVVLTKAAGNRAADTHLLHCARRCASETLEALSMLPDTTGVPSDVCVVLLVVLRESPRFWSEETCAALARRIEEHLDEIVLRTWRPPMFLMAVHAFAKACPSEGHGWLVTECLAHLQHYAAQLTDRDVATLLWSIATLRIAPAQLPLWDALCTRAALFAPRMNRVSRLTMTQALVLQPHVLCDSQAELLGMVCASSRELDGDEGNRDTLERGRNKWGHRQRHAKNVTNEGTTNLHPRPRLIARPGGSSLDLIPFTAHALSDAALVHLFTTLSESGVEATEKLQLVAAHLTQRATLSERLCLQLLQHAQRRLYVSPVESVRETTSNVNAPPLRISGAEEEAWRHGHHLEWVRRHARAQLVMTIVRGGVVHSPREVAEGLCWEDYVVHSLTLSTEDRVDPVTRDGLRSAITTAVKAAWPTAQHPSLLRNGGELWSWICVAAYMREANAVGDDPSAETSSGQVTKGHRALRFPADVVAILATLDASLTMTTASKWTGASSREGQLRWAELVESAAAASNGGTRLLTLFPPSAYFISLAFQCLAKAVRELMHSTALLPIAETLRLISSVETAQGHIAPVVAPLKAFLLTQLETHASHSTGLLPTMTQHIAASLVHSSLVAGRSLLHPRISDAVLDVYVRLLIQEQQRTLCVSQAELLVRCLQERQHQPSALENAFMTLMTRRSGQDASLLNLVKLPVGALCAFIDLAEALPRSQMGTTTVAATTAATTTLIRSTLLDFLITRELPECQTAEELVAAAIVLTKDVVVDLKKTDLLANAVMVRSLELLRTPKVTWTAIQKAYLVASLVCVNVEPMPELLQLLRCTDGARTASL